jgi:hypothetical protein
VPFFFEFVCQGLMFVITQMLLVCVIFPVFSAAMVIATGQSLIQFWSSIYCKVMHITL